MISTSKQLAEALGPKWKAYKGYPLRAWRAANEVELVKEDFFSCALTGDDDWEGYGSTPRAAVLALADKLEAEAKALRESVRKEGT